MEKHTPVMLKEVLEILSPKLKQKFIDCTLGGGGYTQAIAKAVGPDGLVIAVDLDQEAIDNINQIKINNNLPQIKAFKSNFKNIKSIVAENFPDTQFDGIVMDLGLSSAQLADLGRGFSFHSKGSLNMAFDSEKKGKTETIINHYSEKELANLIKKYGEEHYAKSIARKIIHARAEEKITSVDKLVDIIAQAVPRQYRQDKRLHFATRTFQALRIATNDELENLKTILPDTISLLVPNGHLVTVSFHSLEDRIVKQFLVKESKACLCPPKQLICNCGHQATLKIITKKPLVPNIEEVKNNPRSRSAKLRAAIKI